MTLATADNPATKRTLPTPQRHQARWGQWFKETGETRRARTGEHVLTPEGVARATRCTREAYRILRPMEVPA